MTAEETVRPISAMSFEEALAELETIVRGLEEGTAKLEDAIVAYERGIALKQHCETKLQEAEMRVEKIMLGGSGPTGIEEMKID